MSTDQPATHDWFISRLLLHVASVLGDEERLRVEEHLKECEQCRGLAEATRANAASRDRRAGHLPPDLIAAWPKRAPGLRGLEQRMVREHLERCGLCREDLALLGYSPGLVGVAFAPADTAPIMEAPQVAQPIVGPRRQQQHSRRAPGGGGAPWWSWAFGPVGATLAAAATVIVFFVARQAPTLAPLMARGPAVSAPAPQVALQATPAPAPAAPSAPSSVAARIPETNGPATGAAGTLAGGTTGTAQTAPTAGAGTPVAVDVPPALAPGAAPAPVDPNAPRRRYAMPTPAPGATSWPLAAQPYGTPPTSSTRSAPGNSAQPPTGSTGALATLPTDAPQTPASASTARTTGATTALPGRNAAATARQPGSAAMTGSGATTLALGLEPATAGMQQVSLGEARRGGYQGRGRLSATGGPSRTLGGLSRANTGPSVGPAVTVAATTTGLQFRVPADLPGRMSGDWTTIQLVSWSPSATPSRVLGETRVPTRSLTSEGMVTLRGDLRTLPAGQYRLRFTCESATAGQPPEADYGFTVAR